VKVLLVTKDLNLEICKMEPTESNYKIRRYLPMPEQFDAKYFSWQLCQHQTAARHDRS
jgi:hypothetical protein